MKARKLYERAREQLLDHAFTALPADATSDVYIGSDRRGRPVLFVRARDSVLARPLGTALLTLWPPQAYHLTARDGERAEAALYALQCTSVDAGDVDTFLVLVDALLALHEGSTVSGDALVLFFKSMVRLFATPPAKDVYAERVGLWGELFLMRTLRGFRFWAPFWRTHRSRLFDFSAGLRHVEVKTAAGLERVHHFSHRQLYADSDQEVVVASLLVQRADAGLTLRALIEECRQALLGTRYTVKLEGAVRTAAMGDPSDPGPAFDPASAAHSLAWFRSADVPHFLVPEPAGVSQTRYAVDLTVAPRMTSEEVDQWVEMWACESA